MGTVIKLPTAAVSFYAVRKRGRAWGVWLITPCAAGGEMKTCLRTWADRDAAIADAKETAARVLLPFKGRAA